MRVGVYLRVSTDEQTIDNQREVLLPFVDKRGWDPVEFTDESISGARRDRPGYQEMLEAARQGDINAVVVYKLDRLGRSMSQLVTDVERLQDWGVDVVTYDESIDTTSRWGKLQLAVFSALAEIERDLISERTRAAYERKKANGKAGNWGRPKKSVPEWIVKAVAAGEMSQMEAAEQAGVSRTTIRSRVRSCNN